MSTHKTKNMSATTIAPVEAPPIDSTQLRRIEFLRLPKPGQLCPYTGLSRSFINSLVLPTNANKYKPPVRSFVLRRQGARTGVRIVDASSLFSYIRAHEDRGERVSRTVVPAENMEGAAQ
jgi:hypothetical protein